MNNLEAFVNLSQQELKVNTNDNNPEVEDLDLKTILSWPLLRVESQLENTRLEASANDDDLNQDNSRNSTSESDTNYRFDGMMGGWVKDEHTSQPSTSTGFDFPV
ncbi:MAG: hypothetical protein ABIO02_02285 [Patescibacteria group bacterium]